MNSVNNISYTTKNHLCTGCGVCEDICPVQCISIKRFRGEHLPYLEHNKCLGEKCGKCLKVCPGVGITLNEISETLFTDESIKYDKYIGRYVALHTGFSLDDEIRKHCASGGMVSQFLIFLLEKKIIDGAVVTGYDEDNISPRTYIARTKDEILAAKSSKYCPVALNKIGNEIVKSGGKYVIVGLPCHIQGFRKRIAIDRKLRESVIGLFSIYCSSSRTFYSQDYLLQHYGINKNDITYFSYRDNGCLGNLTILTSNKKNDISVPYSHYYGPMLRSFFKPHRCLTCIDHYGELADVCFGDIHIKPYSEDHVGVSSWITRNAFWEQLIIKASEEGYIKMDDVNAETLNLSQAAMLYPKKRRARAVMNIDRLFGRKVAVYDKPMDQPKLKDYFNEIICLFQQFIGKRKSLWFIIEFINRNK